MAPQGKITKKARAAFRTARTQGILAIFFGVLLLIIAFVLGPVEDILTAGVGIADDPIAVAIGFAGIALIIFGINRFAGAEELNIRRR